MRTYWKSMISLVMVLALLLAGCGSTSGKPAEQATDATSAPTEEVTTPADEATEAATEEATEAATEPEETAAESNVSLGEWDGYTYTNHYTGYGCTLDEGWDIYSAEDLQEVSGDVSDILSGTDLDSVVDAYPQILDMMAEHGENLYTLNVNYTGLNMVNRLKYSLMSEEDVADELMDSKDFLIQTYQQAGMDVESIEKVTVSFLGEEHFAVRMNGTISGVNFYMVQILNYDLGAYGVVLTIMTYVEDNTNAILDLFYAVD